MKPLTSARSAELSSRSSRRRQTRNRHNLPMKKMMKKKPLAEEGGQKVLLVRLKDLPEGQAGRPGRLVDLLALPVDQVAHPGGATEDDGPRKA